jgi:zinc transporter ZupT
LVAISLMPPAVRCSLPGNCDRILSRRRIVIIGGAVLGYGLLRNQSLETRLILIALVSGFLITLVTQGMIPEANQEGEPSCSGILYMGGLSHYALMSFTLR